jgi:hypothetical protein
MNLFFISRDPKKCAKYQTDAHVCKMPTETAQILCNVLFIHNHPTPWKEFNPKHTIVRWANLSKANWMWTYRLGIELCKEYTYRYGKVHKAESIIKSLECPPELPDVPFSDPYLAMPDEYKSTNSLNSYRRFYFYGKRRMFFLVNGEWRWKKRKLPKFMIRYLIRDGHFKDPDEVISKSMKLAVKWNPRLNGGKIV